MNLHNLQTRVRLWMEKCFGLTNLTGSAQQRCDRFLEECLELLQACGYDKSRIATLTDYTYSRPVGEVSSEVGGVLVTLAALCNNQLVFMDDAASNALDYINRPEVMQKIRDKQASKNDIHSPLPGAHHTYQCTVCCDTGMMMVVENGIKAVPCPAVGCPYRTQVEQWAEGIYERHTDGQVWYVHQSIANTPNWVSDSETYRMRHAPLPVPTTEQMAIKIAENGKGVEMIDAICKALGVAVFIDNGKFVLRTADVCANCDSALPEGCSGTFHGQPECKWPPQYVYQVKALGRWEDVDVDRYTRHPAYRRRVVIVVPEP